MKTLRKNLKKIGHKHIQVLNTRVKFQQKITFMGEDPTYFEKQKMFWITYLNSNTFHFEISVRFKKY